MNVLSDLQFDALTEVFNVGAGRAAASLSAIVEEEVKLSVPRVEVLKSSEIDTPILSLDSQRVGAVSQAFTGSFNAKAVLLFTESHALEIVRDMVGTQISIQELAEFEQEAMCELGNIILNACMSAIADMLKISLESSLPSYAIVSPEDVFSYFLQDTGQPYVLVLHINLRIERRNSEGNLIFLLSSTSLDRLIIQVDQFLQRTK